MIILDTSAAIEILKATETGAEIRKFLETGEVCITVFTVHELMVGVKENEISKLQGFFASVKTFSFDSMAALESAKIEKRLILKGKKIEESDVFIAGVCLATNSKLFTLDKGFLGIKELDVKVF